MKSESQLKNELKKLKARREELQKKIEKPRYKINNERAGQLEKEKEFKAAQIQYEKALMMGGDPENINKLKEAAEKKMREFMTHDAHIQACRQILSEAGQEIDILTNHINQNEQILSWYPVYEFIEKKFSPEADQFAKVCIQLEKMASKCGAKLIVDNLKSVPDFQTNENGKLSIKTLYRAKTNIEEVN